MLIGVDWSGDPGVRVKPGSQPRCIMAVAVCEDAAALAAALAELRQKRNLKKNFEFHYTVIDDVILRGQFMEAVAGKFIAAVAIYDKDRMPMPAWGHGIDLLVQLIIHCVLALSSATIRDAKMIIDGEREVKPLKRVLRPALSRALEERGVTDRIGKMVPGRSEDYDVIQVADMIAGAVTEATEGHMKEERFLGAARDNVTVLQITPEMEKPAK